MFWQAGSLPAEYGAPAIVLALVAWIGQRLHGKVDKLETHAARTNVTLAKITTALGISDPEDTDS